MRRAPPFVSKEARKREFDPENDAPDGRCAKAALRADLSEQSLQAPVVAMTSREHINGR